VRVDGPAVGEADVRLDRLTSKAVAARAVISSGAELLRLPARPIGQLATGHPVREAQVVLDPELWRPGPPVAVRSISTVRNPSEAPVDAAARPAVRPDDDQVVELLRRRGRQAQRIGQFGGRWAQWGVAAFGDDDR